MKGLAFSVICSPVATRLNINEFQHLEGLEFADEIDADSGMIEILVGADYYTEWFLEKSASDIRS